MSCVEYFISCRTRSCSFVAVSRLHRDSNAHTMHHLPCLSHSFFSLIFPYHIPFLFTHKFYFVRQCKRIFTYFYSLPSSVSVLRSAHALALCLPHTNESFKYIWMWACALYSWNWAWENLTFVIRRWRRSFAQLYICIHIHIASHTHHSGRHRRC